MRRSNSAASRGYWLRYSSSNARQTPSRCAHAGYGYTAKAALETIQSPHQRVEVYDTHQFGKLFRLDGRLMTSEGDEFFYHECMTHPAAR